MDVNSVKRALADWLRRKADRLDFEGAPKMTSWCFTFEPGFGLVFNQDGRGCPLWFMGDREYDKAHGRGPEYGEPHEIEWVTIGMRTEDGVHVLGSATVRKGTTTRRMESHTEVGVVVPTRSGPTMQTAKIPNWVITLNCELTSFVSLPGRTYPDAVSKMFGRDGIRG